MTSGLTQITNGNLTLMTSGNSTLASGGNIDIGSGAVLNIGGTSMNLGNSGGATKIVGSTVDLN